MANRESAGRGAPVVPVFEAPEDASSAAVAVEASDTDDGNEHPDDRSEDVDDRSEDVDDRSEDVDDRSEDVDDRSEDVDGPSENADDIPLDIAGHEEREPPSATDDAAGLLGDDDGDDTEGAEELDDEVEPVEVLVGLADEGEIDPWDIDVVRVTDKFLNALDEADLRTSGRALFYASVLIRMKSDAMLSPDEPDEPAESWQEGMDGEDAPVDGMDPFASLESEMERRLDRKRARGMPQTLDELVRDLREAERDSWWKEGRTYDTSGSPHGFQRGTQELDYRAADDMRMDDEPTADDVTGTTHTEDVDRIIEDVYDAVREQYDAGREEVLFREVSSAGGSRVETYLGLLFLAHRNRVQLQQDELFGDLWIQDPGAATGQEEAVAD